jgi:uncharacterized protein YdeI (YjbR/CyaY-like superfamily)
VLFYCHITLSVKPTFFATPASFRTWLNRHHRTAPELLVGFYKKGTGKPSLTWPESVDQALCFGWIDGVRKRIDDLSYTIRFTPRRTTSKWSQINIRRVGELEQQGLMKPSGRAAFERRAQGKDDPYGYERRKVAVLEAGHLREFKAQKQAWKFFQTQAPSYQRLMFHWVTSATKDETRWRRLCRLIAASAAGKKL